MSPKHLSQRTCIRGGILLSVLVLAVVIATLLAGLGTLVVSYYSRSVTDSNYSSSINLADAGLNYEIRRINQNVANADMPGSTAPYGTNVAFGNGNFTVYCSMTDGTTAWDKTTTPFCITSTGKVNNVSRTVRIQATGLPGNGFAGIFAITSGSTNGNPAITGSIGSDGPLSFGSNSTVNGTIYLYGPGASISSSPSGSYTTVQNPTAVNWPSSSSVAFSAFPNSGATAPGGLGYLSVHNDNTLSSPPIAGKTINISSSTVVTLVGKPGGANYYLTSINMNGQSSFSFDNRLGPINIWCGPTGGSGTFKIAGGASMVTMAADPTKAVRFYVATTNGVTLTGNSELDAGIYDVVGGTNSVVNLGGTSTAIKSTIICDYFSMGGTPQITTPAGYFNFPVGTYTFYKEWTELGGM